MQSARRLEFGSTDAGEARAKPIRLASALANQNKTWRRSRARKSGFVGPLESLPIEKLKPAALKRLAIVVQQSGEPHFRRFPFDPRGASTVIDRGYNNRSQEGNPRIRNDALWQRKKFR